MTTSDTESAKDHILFDPHLRPAFARSYTRTHALSTYANRQIEYKTKPQRQISTPPLSMLTWPKASTVKAVLPVAPVAASGTAESHPFLLSSTKKPVFSPIATGQPPSVLFPPKPPSDSSYIFPDKTLTASALVQGSSKPNADPEGEYPRVFYAPGERPGDDVSASSHLSQTIYASTTPMSRSTYASTATLVACPMKRSELSQEAQETPRVDKGESAVPSQARESVGLVASATYGLSGHSGSSADHTGSTCASSFEWQSAHVFSDSDSGWEIGEFHFAVRSDWSDGDFDEAGEFSDPNAQSVYFDAAEPEVESDHEENSDNKDDVDEDDDGYVADSEAIPHARSTANIDDIDASVARLVPPLGVIRDRQHMRLTTLGGLEEASYTDG